MLFISSSSIRNCASKWKSSSAKKEVKNNPEVECAVEIVEHLKDLSYKLLKVIILSPSQTFILSKNVGVGTIYLYQQL